MRRTVPDRPDHHHYPRGDIIDDNDIHQHNDDCFARFDRYLNDIPDDHHGGWIDHNDHHNPGEHLDDAAFEWTADDVRDDFLDALADYWADTANERPHNLPAAARRWQTARNRGR